MARVLREANRIDAASSRAGTALWDAVKNFGKRNPAATIIESEPGWIRRTGGKFFGGSARAGLWVAEQPVALAMKPVTWTLNGIARFPKFAIFSAVVGSGIAAGSWMNHRQARRAQDERMVQMGEAQAQMAQAQAQMAQAQCNPYQITQADYEAMQAKMRDSSNGTPVNHAERVLAAKQAAAMPPQANDAANLAAL